MKPCSATLLLACITDNVKKPRQQSGRAIPVELILQSPDPALTALGIAARTGRPPAQSGLSAHVPRLDSSSPLDWTNLRRSPCNQRGACNLPQAN